MHTHTETKTKSLTHMQLLRLVFQLDTAANLLGARDTFTQSWPHCAPLASRPLCLASSWYILSSSSSSSWSVHSAGQRIFSSFSNVDRHMFVSLSSPVFPLLFPLLPLLLFLCLPGSIIVNFSHILKRRQRASLGRSARNVALSSLARLLLVIIFFPFLS